MPTSGLPLELQLLVIDHLGAGTANDWQSDPEGIDLDLYSDGGIRFRTLYRCALTCRAWLFRCQIHLYRNVQIVSANGLTVLRETLGRNTTLRGYVRCLKAKVSADSVRLHEILLFVRDFLPTLHTFQLEDWNASTKLRLSNVARSLLAIGFPSVRRLVLMWVLGSRMSYFLRAFPCLERLKVREGYMRGVDTGKIRCPSRLSLTSLRDEGDHAPILFRMLLDRNQNTLTELEMPGHYVQSGEDFISLESFPCLQKLSLILNTYVSQKDNPENSKDLRGAVTLLSPSRPSTTALNDLRFICNHLLQPHVRKVLLGGNNFVHALEAILLAEPYTTTVRVTFEISMPTKSNAALHVGEALKTAFPALQEKGLLRVVFSRASGFGHNSAVRELIVSPDGDWIVSRGYSDFDTSVLVWDSRTETILGELPYLEDHEDIVQLILIITTSSEGPRLLTSRGDSGKIEIWDPACQQHLTTLSDAHTSVLTSATLVTAREGVLLATSDIEKLIYIWDMKTQKHKKLAARGELAPVQPSAISPDARVLVFVPKDKWGTLALWDISADALLAELVDDRGEKALGVLSLAFDNGGETLVAITERGVVLRWSTRTGGLLRSTKLLDKFGNSCGICWLTTRLSPNAKLVCWTPMDNKGDLNLSETEQGRLLWSQSGSRHPNGRPVEVRNVTFSPAADYVAVSTEDEPMQLWRVKDGRCFARNTQFNKAPAINVFSDDGAMLVTGAQDGTISVFRMCDISEGS